VRLLRSSRLHAVTAVRAAPALPARTLSALSLRDDPQPNAATS
jgi:hypothetical protein